MQSCRTMSSDEEATLAVVAGCLFEVSIPVTTPGGWRWANDGDEVTLQAEEVRHGRHRFRFRAEAKGAEVGAVELRFVHDADDAERLVPLQVAPEHFRLGDARSPGQR